MLLELRAELDDDDRVAVLSHHGCHRRACHAAGGECVILEHDGPSGLVAARLPCGARRRVVCDDPRALRARWAVLLESFIAQHGPMRAALRAHDAELVLRTDDEELRCALADNDG